MKQSNIGLAKEPLNHRDLSLKKKPHLQENPVKKGNKNTQVRNKYMEKTKQARIHLLARLCHF